MTGPKGLQSGLVVATHGRHVWVETEGGQRVLCHPRGKKSASVVGDHVRWLPSSDEGSIEKIEPRHNLFFRQDEIRTKSFAANIDQVLILVAAEPDFSEDQLARALIAAESQKIRPIIALNKSDLQEAFQSASQRLETYRAMGYEVISLALKPRGATPSNLEQLQRVLRQKVTLVLGPSGTGKSTLINCTVPNTEVLTNSISSALNSGKHTTTSTTLYWIDRQEKTAVIDSPGFQEFGLNYIEPMQLASLMPDIKANSEGCRFYNCTHLHEPGCSVLEKVKVGAIQQRRFDIYAHLFEELQQKRY